MDVKILEAYFIISINDLSIPNNVYEVYSTEGQQEASTVVLIYDSRSLFNWFHENSLFYLYNTFIGLMRG